MQRILCVLALLAVGGLAEPAKRAFPHKTADQQFLVHQKAIFELLFHIHEPVFIPEMKQIASGWNFESNIEQFKNATAVKRYLELFRTKDLLPRGVPFSIYEPAHRYEAVEMFYVLYSAKDFDTFYKTAVYLRDYVNESLYVYVLYTVVAHRQDTQGMRFPPIYETFPSFFFNGEIMTTAQRINTHGKHMVEHYPGTKLVGDDVVILWNHTIWPYSFDENKIAYFTHDYTLGAYYYYRHILYPQWLGGETVPLYKDNRGEWFWFIHKQLLTRYYMERLSNDLGEIPVLGSEVVEEGYTKPGLLYYNGIPFPVRPNNFNLEQPEFIHLLSHIDDYEHRIRDAIDSGYFFNAAGEHVSIRDPEAIDTLGNLVEANFDSPNNRYYKDFITMWKQLLGNSHVPSTTYHKSYPLVVPSALEHYQTALRDPAFYIIWKRVLHLFNMWHEHLPLYTREELRYPAVTIEKVEVDKLMTFYETKYVNVTNHLHMTEYERNMAADEFSVLVQVPQLNHKVFQTRVQVKSEVAKKVYVKFFLAPKYDSHGNEIPLYKNSENFFLLDSFVFDLPAGESTIRRDSSESVIAFDEWTSYFDLYERTLDGISGKKPYQIDMSESIEYFPQHLLLPKGKVGGMPYVFMVYISEHHEPHVPYGSNFDPITSYGLGTGARFQNAGRLGFPVDRPLHQWQVEGVHNIWFEDVLIYHKQTPGIGVHYFY